jgi:predicted esterase
MNNEPQSPNSEKRTSMNRYSLFVLFLLIIFGNASSQEDPISTFYDFESRVNQLEKDGNYREAIQLTQKVWNQFPEQEFVLMKEMIYLNGKTEQYAKNLQLWETGHQKGYFFLLSPRIKKYEPYLKYPQFDELVRTDEALRQTAFENSKTIYEVVLPAEYTQSSKYPLIFIFHGGGSNLDQAKRSWKIFPLLQNDYIMVYLQSYRPMDSNSFGWLSGDERGHRELTECYDEIQNLYSIDTSRIYLSGISAGATMALDVSFKKILAVRGVIAFCPGMPRNLTTESMITAKPKIYMLGGETDFYLPRQKDLVKLFEKTGVHYIYKIIPGMGHEFPEDYENIVRESLEFIEN